MGGLGNRVIRDTGVRVVQCSARLPEPDTQRSRAQVAPPIIRSGRRRPASCPPMAGASVHTFVVVPLPLGSLPQLTPAGGQGQDWE